MLSTDRIFFAIRGSTKETEKYEEQLQENMQMTCHIITIQ